MKQIIEPLRTCYARAHVNIALSKYWGKRNTELNLPAVPSLSASIKDLYTEVWVRFDPEAQEDRLTIDDAPAKSGEVSRLSAFYDRLREEAGIDWRFQVVSRSTVPRAAGLASSASAFAALALAGSAALGLNKSENELSALARIGSGSAARSLFPGYVAIESSEDEGLAAYPVATTADLPLKVAIVIASSGEKEISSREAMERCRAESPFYQSWVTLAHRDCSAINEAIQRKDMSQLSLLVERNCLAMHAVGMGLLPPILYWNATTLSVMEAVRSLRASGEGVFFTIDAGPNVVVFYEKRSEAGVRTALKPFTPSVRWTEIGGEPIIKKESEWPQ